MENIIDKFRERRLNHALNELGFVLRKSSKPANFSYYDEGGYMIVDPYINGCIAGPRCELDLDDVEEYLEMWKKE